MERGFKQNNKNNNEQPLKCILQDAKPTIQTFKKKNSSRSVEDHKARIKEQSQKNRKHFLKGKIKSEQIWEDQKEFYLSELSDDDTGAL